MLDQKWTGTDADRRDMRTLNLEQVLRVRDAQIRPFSALALLTTAAAQFQYNCNVWLLFNPALLLGVNSYVCHVSLSNDAKLNHFSSTLAIALPNGGTAGLFWNYVITAFGLGFVYASIAELGSMQV
jgi:hypothetical protein